MKIKVFIILLSLFISYSSYSQISTKGLIAHYKFDNSVEDFSIYKNQGLISGSVIPTTNRFNTQCTAYEFDGKTGYITVNHNKALEKIKNEFTISVWAKLSSTCGSYWFTICCKSDQTYEDKDSPHFRFQLTKITTSLNSDFTGEWDQDFSFNNWYFLAVTKKDDKLKYYVNGALILDTIYSKPIFPNKYNLTIGRDIPGRDEFFCGAMDDLRIYNRKLSTKEISDLYTDNIDKNIKSPCEPILLIDTVKQTITLQDTIRNTIIVNDTVVSKVTITDTTFYNDLPQIIGGVPIKYQKTVIVNSRDLRIIPYDNVKEDNDTVSININGIWVREYYKIKKKENLNMKRDPINCTLSSYGKNYLISKACNLGINPPNTLAIDIYDGVSSVKKVIIHSEIGYSGGIRLIYQPIQK